MRGSVLHPHSELRNVMSGGGVEAAGVSGCCAVVWRIGPTYASRYIHIKLPN